MAIRDDFVVLHGHSDYSLLDGAAKPRKYAERAAQLGQPALAVTDHGTLAGSYQLYKECNRVGIQPIIGLEAYIAPYDRKHRSPVFFGREEQRGSDISGGGRYCHITLLAYSSVGVQNLFRLNYEAHLSGFYLKPRIDWEILDQYSEGLICLSGCPSGHVATAINLGRFNLAYRFAGKLRDIFGRERFFIELMNHGLDFEKAALPYLKKLARALKVRTVATPDCHYCDFDDAGAHDNLLAIQTKDKISNPNRFKFDGTGYHLPSRKEMLSLRLPLESVENTLLVAEMVEEYTGLFDNSMKLPRLGEDDDVAMDEAVAKGLVARGATNRHSDQALYESGVIKEAGFPGYFNTLYRAMERGRERGIRFGPARGSAAGATTTWAMRLSDVDPLEHGLLFERFLNPERVSMPDIDIDIEESRRSEFIDLTREEFGPECVAQISTYGTIGAKSALKDTVRVMDLGYGLGEKLASSLPPARFGRAPSLAELPQRIRDQYKAVVAAAEKIEGVTRSAGIHASGIIISPHSLVGKVPLRLKDGRLVTEYTYDELAELGYTKFDFLGLKNLTIIEKTLEFLSQKFGRPFTLPETFDDRKTYDLLSAADTAGVFQLESVGMRKLLRSVRPGNLTDIASVLALYRPGPMGVGSHTEYANRKSGKSPVSYPHREFADSLADILSDTYGIIVFQEQVLKVLAAVGGYTYASAELIFNAMRKKDTAKMLAAKPDFQSRLRSVGYSEEAIDALWETLVPFSDYSFNKSHSVSYAIISYWTAYLKANHPWQYWAALLSCESDKEELHAYLKEIRDAHIPVLPPDINESGISWTVSNQGIRYGTSSIAGVSHNSLSKIRGSGPYRTMKEWWEKAPTLAFNMSILTPLIKSGCFDSLEPDREGLMGSAEVLAIRAKEYRGAPKKLFTSYDLIVQGKLDVETRQLWEQEVLGTAITQPVAVFLTTRQLDSAEWLYVWKSLLAYPGSTPVSVKLGPLTTLHRYAHVTLDQKLIASLELMGLVLESEIPF